MANKINPNNIPARALAAMLKLLENCTPESQPNQEFFEGLRMLQEFATMNNIPGQILNELGEMKERVLTLESDLKKLKNTRELLRTGRKVG